MTTDAIDREQFDALAAKVDALSRDNQFLRTKVIRDIEQLDENRMKMGAHNREVLARVERLENAMTNLADQYEDDRDTILETRYMPECFATPPAAPEPDDAATWEDPRPWRAVADAYDAAYAALDDPMNFHDNDSCVAGVQAAVAKAIERGLAAPADRAVVVTDVMVDAALAARDRHEMAVEGRRTVFRAVIEAALRAAGRGVVVTDAMVEAALDIINPHIIATKRIVSCDLMDRAIEAALRAAERGEGE